MPHTSYYNDCKNKVKAVIKNPKTLKFWTQTSGKRKDIITTMSKIDDLTSTYKSPGSQITEKNQAVDELKKIFNKVLLMAKQCKEYVELRLMFMKIEDTLIECGFDPTSIDEAMIEEEPDSTQQ